MDIGNNCFEIKRPFVYYKPVEKEEFDSFVKDYPSALEWDVCKIGDPALGSYNDFSDGKKWPESMVAKISLHSDGKKEYFIKKVVNYMARS
jgi:hypothetical protein